MFPIYWPLAKGSSFATSHFLFGEQLHDMDSCSADHLFVVKHGRSPTFACSPSVLPRPPALLVSLQRIRNGRTVVQQIIFPKTRRNVLEDWTRALKFTKPVEIRIGPGRRRPWTWDTHRPDSTRWLQIGDRRVRVQTRHRNRHN